MSLGRIVRVALALTIVSLPAVARAQAAADPTSPAPAPAPAEAADTGAGAGEEKLVPFALEGYVNLGVGLTYVPRAVPRDQVGYGLRSSRAGIILRGTPFSRFSYVVHFGVNPEAVDVLSDAELVDRDGNGGSPDIGTKTTAVTPVPIEEVSIAYAITPWWSVKGGHLYMRFSPGASVLITSQMFPTRPEPTQTFMIGPDQGISTTATFAGERLELSAGAFNGSSLELGVPGTSTRGPALVGLIDAHPFGKMPDVEGDPERGPFRMALGIGGIYRAGTLFESTGYEATHFREARLDAALRIAFRGLFVQGEYLKRQLVDDLSNRAGMATGAYVQGSFFQPIPGTKVAIAPLGRYGVSVADQTFAPRRTIEIEAGLAFFPRADLDDPNKLRFILQYDGEQRLPEGEVAHGAVLHAQLRW